VDGTASTAQGWFAVADKRAVSSYYLRWPLVSVTEFAVTELCAAEFSGAGLSAAALSAARAGQLGEAIPAARRRVRGALRDWGITGELSEDIELTCAELVANAVTATLALIAAGPSPANHRPTVGMPPRPDSRPTAGMSSGHPLSAAGPLPPSAAWFPEPPPIGMRLLGNAQRLVLEVWDCHPALPVRRDADTDATCGRGLTIVAALSNRWGTRRLSPRLKTVWAEFLLLSPGGDAPRTPKARPMRNRLYRACNRPVTKKVKEMSDDYPPLTAVDLAMMPARELLAMAGELFAALLSAPAEFSDADRDRARLLRLALAEAVVRAARIYPAPPHAATCSCGERFGTLEELDEHFWAVFVPADDTGLDGKPHAELVRDFCKDS
jgi:hypothetical protein